MKKIITSLPLLVVLVTSVYAADPALTVGDLRPLSGVAAPAAAAPAAQQAINLESAQVDSGKQDSIQSLAQDLSYFGAVLITAHEVLTSLKSWADILEYTSADGSQIELTKTPKGMGVMVRLSMPLD